jgi:hypothetical protein
MSGKMVILDGKSVKLGKVERAGKLLPGVDKIADGVYSKKQITITKTENGVRKTELSNYAVKLYKQGLLTLDEINKKYNINSITNSFFAKKIAILNGKVVKINKVLSYGKPREGIINIGNGVYGGYTGIKDGKVIAGKTQLAIYNKSTGKWNNKLLSNLPQNDDKILNEIAKIQFPQALKYKNFKLPEYEGSSRIIIDVGRNKINIVDNNVYLWDISINTPQTGNILDFIYKYKRFQDKYNDIRIVYADGDTGIIKLDAKYNLTKNTSNFKKYNRGHTRGQNQYVNYGILTDIMNGSDGYILKNGDAVVFLTPNDEIIGSPIKQKYLDDIDENIHCFFTPMQNKFFDLAIDSKGKSTRERYMTLSNKLDRYIKQYPNGIPEDEIQPVIDDLRVKVEIYDITNKMYKDYRPADKHLTTFTYKNSRFNHLDHFTFNTSKEAINSDKYELEEMMINLINENKFFVFGGSASNPYYIQTNGEYYKLKNGNEAEIYDEFLNYKFIQENAEVSLNDIKFDLKQDEELTDFILSGVRFTTHYEFNNDYGYGTIKMGENGIYNLDIKNAYTQFKSASTYQGFPSLFNVFTKGQFTINHIEEFPGYYYIEDIDYTSVNNNVMLYLTAMRLDNGVYTSPELLLFNKYGVKFNITAGTYSINPFHFEFVGDMMQKNEDGVYRYSIMTGKMNSNHFFHEYNIYNNEPEFRQILKNKYDDCVVYDDYISIKQPNKQVNSLSHIAGFITAYTRINMFDKMFNLPYENCMMIKLDEIIYKQPLEASGIWRQKDENIKLINCSRYYYDLTGTPNIENIPELEFLPTTRKILFNGMGGSGKTHYCLSNKGFCNKLFTALCWRLIVDKKKEYGVVCRSFNRLIGKNTEIYSARYGHPSVIVIDEITQINDDDIYKAYELYPNSLIICLGDIDEFNTPYQCMFPDVNLVDYDFFDYVKTFEKSYRCKDDNLLALLEDLRECMSDNYENITHDAEAIFAIKDLLKIVDIHIPQQNKHSVENIKNLYNNNDTILVSTINGKNNQVDYYTNLFKHLPKYMCINHSFTDVEKRMNGDESIILTGEITHIEQPRTELKHAFTIHSTQGITIKNPNKLFIDVNRIFDYQQLYTAISRVEYLDQIIIIK